MITGFLVKIQSGQSLSEQEMQAAISGIMEGTWNNEQIAAFLMGLSQRGETVEEITGAARVMREKALPIKAPDNAVDCCGTGGDKSGTYNISTAVAIVTAACGIPVAKHGNRSASSKSGAADVLEALGINLDISQENLEKALTLYNFAFLMAPHHHSAMKYVIPVRKAIAIRTLFNILGPLANPAKTKYQLLGVFKHELVMPMTQALQKLGTQSAWVVHGSDGLDEITTTGTTYVAQLHNGTITESVLTPQDFGLAQSDPKDLIGGTATVNAKALLDILGGAKNAYRDIVIANSAAILIISGSEDNLIKAAQRAAKTLDDGTALELLNQYKNFTQKNGA